MLKGQLNQLADEYYAHTDRINEIIELLTKIANKHPLCRLIMSIFGIWPINATAIYSAIGNGSQFSNGREFLCGSVSRCVKPVAVTYLQVAALPSVAIVT